jgi:dolichyl-phosphate-mannose-protein mannosyltransferase
MVGLDTAVSTGAKHESDLRRRNIPDTSNVHLDSNRMNDEDVKKARSQVR